MIAIVQNLREQISQGNIDHGREIQSRQMEHPYHKEEHQIMQEEKIVNDDEVEQEP